MSISEILNGAADLIERDGWCQGLFRRGKRRCIDYAVMCAAPNAATYPAAHSAMRAYLQRDPVRWNDAPERTQAEVIAALRDAAQIAKADHP